MSGSEKPIRSPSPPSADEIGEAGGLALRELMRRLESPELAADLPGTGLLQLALQVVKSVEPEKPDDDTPDTDVLDVISKTEMTPKRKAELLGKELDKLKVRAEQLRDAAAEVNQ